MNLKANHRPATRNKPRKAIQRDISGWLILDKPSGITSARALARVKHLLGARKAGHGGTLDPLATGVLPIALGEATKTVPYMMDMEKVYRFTVRWGSETDTDDTEGVVVKTCPQRPSRASIRSMLPRFTGRILQAPPVYSAIKISGKRACDIARKARRRPHTGANGNTAKVQENIKELSETAVTTMPFPENLPKPLFETGPGVSVSTPDAKTYLGKEFPDFKKELPEREVVIYSIALLPGTEGKNTTEGENTTQCDSAEFEVRCAKGTYVRALARDIGRQLGCFGHVIRLRRCAVGYFSEDDGIALETLEEIGHNIECNAAQRGEQQGEFGIAPEDATLIRSKTCSLVQDAIWNAVQEKVRPIACALMNIPQVPVSRQAAIALRYGKKVQVEPVSSCAKVVVPFQSNVGAKKDNLVDNNVAASRTSTPCVAMCCEDPVAIGTVTDGWFVSKRVLRTVVS